jgi:hypothetical protein
LNYKTGSAEGISLAFLTVWLIGDATNLAGTRMIFLFEYCGQASDRDAILVLDSVHNAHRLQELSGPISSPRSSLSPFTFVLPTLSL